MSSIDDFARFSIDGLDPEKHAAQINFNLMQLASSVYLKPLEGSEYTLIAHIQVPENGTIGDYIFSDYFKQAGGNIVIEQNGRISRYSFAKGQSEDFGYDARLVAVEPHLTNHKHDGISVTIPMAVAMGKYIGDTDPLNLG